MSWPIVTQIVDGDILLPLKFMVSAGAVVSLWQVIRRYGELANLRKIPLQFQVIDGPHLPAPVTAYRNVVIGKPTIRFGLRILAVMMFLNCFIPASYMYPAVVGNDVVEESRLVLPLTQWEMRPRFHEYSGMAVFYAPTEDQIWIMEIEYIIRHNDILTPYGECETWLNNLLRLYVDNFRSQLLVTEPEDADAIQNYYVSAFSHEEILSSFQYALVRDFIEEYEHVGLYQLDVKVRHLTMSEYIEYYKRDQ